MKATDLMIGDYIQDFAGDLCQVIVLDRQVAQVETLTGVHQGDTTRYLYEAEGIPLTPEILEKNAIISENTVCIKVDNVLFPICNIFWEDSTKTEINCLLLQNYVGQMIMPTIKYVHEFQHLLRILKIEKEIVL